MSSPVSRTVNIYINQVSAERSLNALQKTAGNLNKTIDKGRQAGKDMTTELTKLADTEKKIKNLQDIMSGKIAPSIRQVRSYVQELRRELEGMSADTPGYAAKFREF